MAFAPSLYRRALQSCLPLLEAKDGKAGTEKIIRDALLQELRLIDPEVDWEVPLSHLGGQAPGIEKDGRVDIVTEAHGIELKVMRMPRLGSSPNQALYDLGQLANDALKLRSARKLRSGELVVLLRGPLVEDLGGSGTLYREFHNRLFVDFAASRAHGELHPDRVAREPARKQAMRKAQIRTIRSLGLDTPCGEHRPAAAVRIGRFALIVLQVK